MSTYKTKCNRSAKITLGKNTEYIIIKWNSCSLCKSFYTFWVPHQWVYKMKELSPIPGSVFK